MLIFKMTVGPHMIDLVENLRSCKLLFTPAQLCLPKIGNEFRKLHRAEMSHRNIQKEKQKKKTSQLSATFFRSPHVMRHAHPSQGLSPTLDNLPSTISQTKTPSLQINTSTSKPTLSLKVNCLIRAIQIKTLRFP